MHVIMVWGVALWRPHACGLPALWRRRHNTWPLSSASSALLTTACGENTFILFGAVNAGPPAALLLSFHRLHMPR